MRTRANPDSQLDLCGLSDQRRLRVSPIRSVAGFTLVEVLIALLILALAMGALQVRMASHLDNAAYLRDQTQAGWVAQNQLELFRLSQQLGSSLDQVGSSGSETLAGRTWYWSVQPLPIPGADALVSVVPVQIGVSPGSAELARTAPLVSVQTIMELSDVR